MQDLCLCGLSGLLRLKEFSSPTHPGAHEQAHTHTHKRTRAHTHTYTYIRTHTHTKKTYMLYNNTPAIRITFPFKSHFVLP